MGFLYFLAFIAALLPLAFFAEPMYAEMFYYCNIPALGINTSIINLVIFPGGLIIILLIAIIFNCVRTTRENKLLKDRAMFKPLAMYTALILFTYGIRVLSQHCLAFNRPDLLYVIMYEAGIMMLPNFIISILFIACGVLLFLFRHRIARNASMSFAARRIIVGGILVVLSVAFAFQSLTTFAYDKSNLSDVNLQFPLMSFSNILIFGIIIGVALVFEIIVSIVWQVKSKNRLVQLPDSEFDPNLLPMRKQKIADRLRKKLNHKLDKSDANIDRQIESIFARANARAAA